MAEITSSGQRRIDTLDGKISLNQGDNSIKVETKTKAILPPSQGGNPGDIQRAIDAIRLTGGVITLRNGTYTESADINIPSGVHLVGESFGGVVIVFSSGAIKSSGLDAYSTGTIAISPDTNTVTGTDTEWASNLTTNHKIRINGIPFAIASVDSDTSLTLATTYVGQPLSGAPYLASILVEKVDIENIVVISSAVGIQMQYVDLLTITNTVTPSGFSLTGSSRITTDQFIVESASGSGFSINSTDFINMERTLASNCGGHGFDINDSRGVVLTSCPSFGNTENGFNIVDCSPLAINICQASGNVNGINAVRSSGVLITGGDMSGNSADGMNFSDDSDGNIITGVISNGNGGYGINISDSTCDNNRITGNQLLGNSTGDINDDGTDTVIIQDSGLTSVDWGDVGGTLSDQTDLQTALDDKADTDSVVESVVAGTNVTVDDTDPQNPIVSASGGGSGVVESVVAGNNIDVDATDPANPIVAVETLTLSDISDVTATATEVNYVDGVTSAIQTQLNLKLEDVDISDINATGTPSSSTYLRGDGSWSTPASGSSFSWTEVTGTSQSASVDNGYITNNAGLVTVTIPTTAPVGSIVRIAGKGAGGWKVAQNTSEIIHFGKLNTTTGTGGSLQSTNRYDAIELVCIVANTEWLVLSSVGNIEVV